MAKGTRLFVSKREGLWCETMREPRVVLDTLRRIAKENPTYVFDKLYRNLYNREFYLMAYGKMYPKQGNMTEGTDGQTIDGFSLDKIDQIIQLMMSEQFQPQPARRVYIPKKQGGRRPLGIPSTYDKIVQEVVRTILENIYEDSFSEQSHGFRPERSCHTALSEVTHVFKGTKWWIEGDIKGFFDNIDHETLINILRLRIADEKFIRLIWKFLRAGYLEDWKLNNTFSGTPQGGIVSPLLANIYLNELDKYMESYKLSFDLGKRRKDNKEYHNLTYKINVRKKKILNQSLDMMEISRLKAEIKEMELRRNQISASDPMDENYKRINYVRYADDFLIGVIGSKEEAEVIKEDIKNFLNEKLKLQLSAEKTLITHWSSPVKFLGFEIITLDGRSASTRKVYRKNTEHKQLVRSTSGLVTLSLPHEVIQKFMLKNDYMKISNNGKWLPIERRKYKNHDDLEIVNIYNAELTGFYNYYSVAGNIRNLNSPYWIIRQSFLKTLAMKYKTNTGRIAERFSLEGKLGVFFENSKGEKKFREFYNQGFQKRILFSDNADVDIHVNTALYSAITKLEDRLKANTCEWCGTVIGKMEVHHVRKLKDLKGKAGWEKFMIARKRKTVVLCISCHQKLHQGKLD
jgi:group II intron reverse transcriptase/maturase